MFTKDILQCISIILKPIDILNMSLTNKYMYNRIWENDTIWKVKYQSETLNMGTNTITYFDQYYEFIRAQRLTRWFDQQSLSVKVSVLSEQVIFVDKNYDSAPVFHVKQNDLSNIINEITVYPNIRFREYIISVLTWFKDRCGIAFIGDRVFVDNMDIPILTLRGLKSTISIINVETFRDTLIKSCEQGINPYISSIITDPNLGNIFQGSLSNENIPKLVNAIAQNPVINNFCCIC